MGVEDDLSTPQAATRPFKLLPGLSPYATTSGDAGPSGRDTGTGQWGVPPATYGQRKLLSRVADVYHRKQGAAKFLWQRKYPHWDTPSPNKPLASALVSHSHPHSQSRSLQFSHSASHSRAMTCRISSQSFSPCVAAGLVAGMPTVPLHGVPLSWVELVPQTTLTNSLRCNQTNR